MRDAQTRRGLYALIAALLIVLTAALTAALSPGGSDLFSRVTEPLTRPLKSAMTGLVAGLEQVYDYMYRYDTLAAENEELRARVARLEEEYREYTEISEENERLRALLGFKSRNAEADYLLEPASVISWTASNFASTCTLNRGAAAGIELHDAVITADGCLVGLVTQVGNSTATVMTLLDASMSVGALLETTGEAGLAEGDFALFREGRLKLGYLEGAGSVIIGDTVVTSGRSGWLPGGLVIGAVESLRADPAGSGSYAVIAPAADITGATAVYVITGYKG
ncbi:MAG: rod shape-determining protein MreC [bacterium]